MRTEYNTPEYKEHLTWLDQELKKGLNRWSPLYRLLRDRLRILGFWKARKRGNPVKGYKMAKAKHKGV